MTSELPASAPMIPAAPRSPASPASPDSGPDRSATWLSRQPIVLRWGVLILASALLAVVLQSTHLPAALLLAPMIAGIAVSLSGARLKLHPLSFRLSQALVGCMIARTLTLPVLHEITLDWPLFLGGVVSVIAASMVLGYLLARFKVLPGSTAIWGSSPGAASAMTLMSASFGADIRLVAFMQYTRVVIVAGAAAIVARIAGGAEAGAVQTLWLAAPDWGQLAGTLALAAASVGLGAVLPIPAAPLLLPLVLGAVLQNLGLLTIELPPLLLALAYTMIGWSVGLRFDRAVIAHVVRALPKVLASIFCLVTVCGGLAALLVVFAGVDPLSAYLATSPGGADTVAIIASSAKVDVPFVMAMQTARLLLIIITGPTLARIVARRLGD